MKKIEIKKNKNGVEKKVKSPFFSVSVTFGDIVLRTKGADVVECLNQLKPAFTLKTKAIILVKSGKRTATKILYPVEMRRLLSKTFNKQVFAKRMLAVMK